MTAALRTNGSGKFDIDISYEALKTVFKDDRDIPSFEKKIIEEKEDAKTGKITERTVRIRLKREISHPSHRENYLAQCADRIHNHAICAFDRRFCDMLSNETLTADHITLTDIVFDPETKQGRQVALSDSETALFVQKLYESKSACPIQQIPGEDFFWVNLYRVHQYWMKDKASTRHSIEEYLQVAYENSRSNRAFDRMITSVLTNPDLTERNKLESLKEKIRIVGPGIESDDTDASIRKLVQLIVSEARIGGSTSRPEEDSSGSGASCPQRVSLSGRQSSGVTMISQGARSDHHVAVRVERIRHDFPVSHSLPIVDFLDPERRKYSAFSIFSRADTSN